MYKTMEPYELRGELEKLTEEYEKFQMDGKEVMMARGNPSARQLELSMSMLDVLNGNSNCFSENGADCRNYGEASGIIEAKRLFAEYMGISINEIIVTGSQSTTFMYDCMSRAMLTGVLGSKRPWCKEEKVKFICLVPGYDKHFRMCEFFGIEMISVPLLADGPDMDEVEKIVAEDESVKGIWCVPKYSNPLGCVYSDEKVRRLAGMKTKAEDFRIFWDNAYAMHYVYRDIPLLNILDECKKAGHPNRPYIFGSTSKMTFPAAGVSFFGASEDNIRFTQKQISIGVNSYDKMNMLRHVRYLKNVEHIKELMGEHARILRAKFEIVLDAFDKELAPTGAGSWIRPDGGYFITYKAENGCAKRIVALCKAAGVAVTDAGATHPYGRDPEDAYIRIAPSLPEEDDLSYAMKVFCLAAKIATAEALLKERHS